VRGLDLPLKLGADALALPRHDTELSCLFHLELDADSLNGGAVSGNALRLTEELVFDHLLRLIVCRLAEPPLILAVQLEDLVLRLVGQILLEVADIITLLDTVLLGNMGLGCVHDLRDCLRGGTSILLLFPTDYCGGFLFQFFLSGKGSVEPHP